ncbi:MAG: radical SAM protein [Candidatus Omnitrophica bacterium]|nr:radical SAM protein [Candidatus Omnitrophota bacterium]MBU4477821.1 radical SAM protein [Candidatus Omnitrophota bacterium]MCG2703543.1 radical SAM protein [Candidatus Omnitrophota bacterium]
MNGSLYYNLYYSFVLRKPKLLFRLLINTIKAKIFKKKVLRYLDICVSSKCNLKCAHCFATAFEKEGENELSLDEWQDVSNQATDLGCVTYGITGGEPLLYEKLTELLKRMHPFENLITINTNGTLLTDELARRLYRSGVDIFQFSMDSSISEEHDKFRKMDGTYDKLMNAIRIAKKNRLKVTIVCTVSHKNMQSQGVKGVIDFAVKNKLLLIFSRATPAGEWVGKKEILLTKEDQEYMYNIVKKYPNVRTDMDTNFGPYGCSAATEKLYVTSFGDVVPCPFMHIGFGNVRKNSLKKARENMLSLARLNCYSPICHVAEDAEFIENILSKTFKSKKIIDWKSFFTL